MIHHTILIGEKSAANQFSRHPGDIGLAIIIFKANQDKETIPNFARNLLVDRYRSLADPLNHDTHVKNPPKEKAPTCGALLFETRFT